MAALRRWLRTDLLIIGLYLGLTLVLTYPLVTHLTTHVPGTNVDEYAFVWNLWWFKHAIFDLHTSPLYTQFIFYPLGVSLVLYTLNILNDVLALPLLPLLGLVATSNVILIFSFVISGYGAYLLVRYLLNAPRTTDHGQQTTDHGPQTTDHRPQTTDHGPRTTDHTHLAAFVAGLVYAFTASRFVYAALGHYDLLSTEWLPFYVLFLIKALRQPASHPPVLQRGWEWVRYALSEMRYALAAGLFATLNMYGERTFGIFLGLFTLLYLAFALAGKEASPRLPGRVVAWRLVTMVAVATILYLPVLIPTLREMLLGDYALEGWGGAEFLSADLLGFFTPTILHPLWGQWAKQTTAQFADINTVFLGYLATALAIFAAVRYRRRLAVWTVTALASAILALGPLLHVNGRTLFDLDGLEVSVPLPFIILHYLPIVQANRVPNRFSVLLTLALAVLVGCAVADLLSRVRRRSLVLGLAGLLAALLVFEGLAVPLPLTDARVPDVYRQIASEPDDFAILQLPLGWRNSFGTLGAERTQMQYYQAVHGKSIPNGNTSRNPPFKFAYFARVPIFKSITDLEMYQEVSPEQRERDRLLAPEVVYFFDLRYVILHPALPGYLPYADTQGRTEAYVRQVLPLEPQPFYEQDGVVAYRVRQSPVQSDLSVDCGTEAALLYQGEGWGRNEEIAGTTANWAVARQARLFVPLRSMGDYTLTIGALPLTYPGSPPQTMTVQVNGHRLPDRLALAPAWTPYTVTVPARLLHPGLNEVILEFAWTAVPGKVLPGSADPRPLATAVDFVRVQKAQ
jgi:hypothetical protein